MYKRKKKVRVSHTKKRKPSKPVSLKRRKPMTKKKAPADDAYDDDEPAEEDMVSTAPEDTEPPQPELTTTEPADGDTYKVGQDCTVKGQFYASGAVIVLTPEELESVQAVGIKIHPAE